MAPLEVAVADEIVERSTDGQARDAEVAAETPLGRDRLPDLQLVDELENSLPRRDLCSHPGPYGSTRLGLWSEEHHSRASSRIFALLTPETGLCQSPFPWVVV